MINDNLDLSYMPSVPKKRGLLPNSKSYSIKSVDQTLIFNTSMIKSSHFKPHISILFWFLQATTKQKLSFHIFQTYGNRSCIFHLTTMLSKDTTAYIQNKWYMSVMLTLEQSNRFLILQQTFFVETLVNLQG